MELNDEQRDLLVRIVIVLSVTGVTLGYVLKYLEEIG